MDLRRFLSNFISGDPLKILNG